MLRFRKLIRKVFKLDYAEVFTEEIPHDYTPGAPIPECSIMGCYEERHYTSRYIYNFCKHHFDTFLKGINVIRCCDHPTCNVDIIADIHGQSKYCGKHINTERDWA